MKTGVQKIRHFQKLELNTPWQKYENYRRRGRMVVGISNYLCNRCLLPLML
jgi:hypothetical protein